MVIVGTLQPSSHHFAGSPKKLRKVQGSFKKAALLAKLGTLEK